ncbi:tryptophan-rich sensory protein [Citricoccus zhacaiensis]|uniref:Tryptophan-rich sensory protein n=1 Tax=Citricoccus zhacaiensis TaxID=489142 RepID=A0ABQ2M5K6_9MICC|nr:tryptophan-rich sensory protein [Citricoccus zhacaiensis]GGO47185.1 tryptophan-rich sensory protein [Citricoccus zhacaiensis]
MDATAPRTTGLAMPLLVLVSGIVATAGAFLGSGILGGTPIAEAAGGWLNEDSTPLAPASGAFRIWSVIYLGLLAYSVWQLLPAQRRSDRQGLLRPWAVAAMLLNSAWIWVVQFGWLNLSLVVIMALLAVLGRILMLLVSTGSSGRMDALIADGTFGLYLGWVTIATVANTSAVLGAAGFDGFGLPVTVLSSVVLAVAAVIGVATAWRSGGKVAPALALAWGLAWITVGRLDGGLESTGTAVAAGVAAAVVLMAAAVFRMMATPRVDPERIH